MTIQFHSDSQGLIGGSVDRLGAVLDTSRGVDDSCDSHYGPEARHCDGGELSTTLKVFTKV